MASHPPRVSQKPKKLSMYRVRFPSLAFSIPIDAPRIIRNEMIAEYRGVILSVSQPNSGLPNPLKTAKIDTAVEPLRDLF